MFQKSLIVVLAIVIVAAPMAWGRVQEGSGATDAPKDVAPEGPPPDGLGGLDPWLDANGDKMFGDIELGDHDLVFSNGVLSGSAAGSGLRFAGDEICTAGSLACRGAEGPIGPIGPQGPTGFVNDVDCAPAGFVRAALAGNATCALDQDTTYAAGSGLVLDGITFHVDSTQVQARIAGACAQGQAIQLVEESGTVGCQSVGTGTVTNVSTGAGLQGGPISTSGTISVANLGITNSMLAATAVTSSKIVDGTIVAADVDVNAIQRRVTGTCASGSSIATVGTTGTVTCNALGWIDNGTSVRLATTSDFVGIGTATPTAPLEVAGDTRIGGSLRMGDAMLCKACIAPQFEFNILTSGLNAAQSSAAIGADGLAIVSFYENVNSDLAVARCDDLSCSSATINLVDSGPSNAGPDPSIAIGADGLPIISYRDTGFGLKVAHCDDAACASSSIVTLDSGGGGMTSIAIGTDGFPIISYARSAGFGVNLYVAHCNDVACSTSSLHVITNNGDVGSHSDIAIGSDGLPVVSYYRQTSGDLWVAHCDNVACSSHTTATVDSAGGRGNSIAIGSDGFPVVSYFNTGQADLRVAHCVNVACTSRTIASPDLVGNVGEDTSIAIVNGLPVVSYVDSTNDAVKLARCSNVACTASTLTTLDGQMNDGLISMAGGANGLLIVSYQDASGSLKVATLVALDGLLAQSSKGFAFFTTADASTGAQLLAGSGSWSSLSDRHTKTALVAADPRAMLKKVVELPLYAWSYIAQGPGVRHLGPMAQDFYAAFGLGESDRHISQVDADGVALVAIQGLHEILVDLDAENDRLRAKNAELEERLARVEAMLSSQTEDP